MEINLLLAQQIKIVGDDNNWLDGENWWRWLLSTMSDKRCVNDGAVVGGAENGGGGG